jgi:hypothetical protein
MPSYNFLRGHILCVIYSFLPLYRAEGVHEHQGAQYPEPASVSTSGLTTWSQFSVQVFHAPVLLPRRNDACKSSKVGQLGNEVRSACAQDKRRAAL